MEPAKSFMSAAEAVFWLSLFGLEFGASLVIPQYWKRSVGLTVLILSAIGFAWSIINGFGLGPKISTTTLGPTTFVVIVCFSAFMFVLMRFIREREFELYLSDAADDIRRFLATHTIDPLAHLDPVSWRKCVNNYWRSCGKRAVGLVRESGLPNRKEYIKGLKMPSTIKELATTAEIMDAFSYLSDVKRYRFKRYIKAILQGIGVGTIVFIFAFMALAMFTGTFYHSLSRYL